MDIEKRIDEYLKWLKQEIRFYPLSNGYYELVPSSSLKKKARFYAKYGIHPSFFIAFDYNLVISMHLKRKPFYPIFG